MNNFPSKQKGFVVGTSLVVVTMIIAFIYTTFGQEVTESTKNRLEEQKEEWLSETRNSIYLWYQRNQTIIDSNPDPLALNDILSGAGIVMKGSVQIESTARLSDGLVSFHRIAVWFPKNGVTGTGFDGNGIFETGIDSHGQPANINYSLIDGRMIEIASYRNTVSRMRSLVKQFEFWFQAQIQINPSRNIGDNHFRADDCVATVPNERLPCIDTFTELNDESTSSVQAKVGFNDDDIRDDWGQTYTFTNLQDLPTPPPYVIALQSTPPWGTPITVYGFAND